MTDQDDKDIQGFAETKNGLAFNSMVSPPVAPPVVKRLAVSSTESDTLPPISMDIVGGTGTIMVNETQFQDMLHSLTPKHGVYKGTVVTKAILEEVVKEGAVLLKKENLFEEGIAEKYVAFQKDVTSRLVNLISNEGKKIRDPVNQLKEILNQIPKDVLGDLPEINTKLLARIKKHKTEVERIEREAAQKDAELRTFTMKVLAELAQLPGSLANARPVDIKAALDNLADYEDLEVHPEFKEEFAGRLALTKESLSSLYTGTLAQEKAAQEKAAQEKAEQAKKEAELKKLREEKEARDKVDAARKKAEAEEKMKQEQQLTASNSMMKISSLYGDSVGGSLDEIDAAFTKMERLATEQYNNPAFDREKAAEVLGKLASAIEQAKDDEKKALEEARKEEEAAKEALINSNKALLVDAGFALANYGEKGNGYDLPDSDKMKLGPVLYVSDLATATNDRVKMAIYGYKQELAERLKRKEKEEQEAEAKAKASEAKEKASFESAKAEMVQAIMQCETHEDVIEAIVAGIIPHVKFEYL